MALDGIVTRAIASELQSLQGARIGKVHQPSGSDIVFQIRSRAGGKKLLLSASLTYPRVQFTEQSYMNPPEAPMFCMLLRKHCEGGIIEKIEQVGMERILHFWIRQRDEVGDVSLKKLVVELMGRHSNIILLDASNNTILDGIHHVTPAISSYRVVMPGFQYQEPPQQHKLNPLEAGRDEFMQKWSEHAEVAPVNRIVDAYTGISPLIAQEVLHRASAAETPLGAGESVTEAVWTAFDRLMAGVREGSFEPSSGLNARGKLVFSAVPLTLIEGELRRFDSISTCMEHYYGDKADRDTVKQKVSDLLKFLQNERSKNVKKLDHLDRDIEEAQDAEQYRIHGELLFASLHLLERGMKEIELVNFYDEEQRPVKIQLDPQLGPSDNAQRYFKKYNKYKNSLAVIDEQIKKTHAEISYMDNLLQQLNDATLRDVDEIRAELAEQGYVRNRVARGAKKKKKNDKPTLHVYTSSEGIEIYVGKNNLQNEYITNRLAHSGDTWLHTKDIPGSHVVIRSAEYGEATLNEAAQLSAYFSQAKHSSSVPVDTTQIRHVHKPSGSKPGFVIYDHQKTLFVTPDEDLIKALPSAVKNA
ncbi:NFACT RNA binding domain-containing protein [Saccharibacillus sp. CPCC 101409]|uniref:Rqc2 family fibronectin-binding protein n=1 Tax=Saccharibacillus sp. CPCC 101409 TaxID=3058041 RepID=UPI002671EF44|nr:NFACT RNA binding domain-containing protein [Saccharibacillus sp. CPCC 101409]MDO3409367.1 NFACT RNA binding domain-containing protein [Saccharibacillus sp. CPCC 101409]